MGVFLIGAFAIGAAVSEWAFFWRNHGIKLIERFIGRLGVRIFYGVLGILFCAGGLGVCAGY